MAEPAWLSPIAEQTWGQIPNSALSSSGVMETGAGAVIDAWGGAILNTGSFYTGTTQKTGKSLVLWGGGHTDYSGNEVYVFGRLEDDAPAWHEVRNPTSPAVQNVNEDGSGNPVSRHTYQSLVYLAATNEMVALGGLYRYSDAAGVLDLHQFDFDTSDPDTNQPWSSTYAVLGTAPADCCAYESSSNRVWYHEDATGSGQSTIAYYDVSGNSHSRAAFKSPGWTGGDATMACDQNRGLLGIKYGSGTGFQFYRTNNGTANDYYAPTTTGTAPSGLGALTWDSARDRFVVWLSASKTLYFLTPPSSNPYSGGNAWVWSSYTAPVGVTPSAQAGGGTFGRFQYVSDPEGYLLLNDVTENIYFFRLAKQNWFRHEQYGRGSGYFSSRPGRS